MGNDAKYYVISVVEWNCNYAKAIFNVIMFDRLCVGNYSFLNLWDAISMIYCIDIFVGMRCLPVLSVFTY